MGSCDWRLRIHCHRSCFGNERSNLCRESVSRAPQLAHISKNRMNGTENSAPITVAHSLQADTLIEPQLERAAIGLA